VKLTVPHNWQSDLVDSIDLSCVDGFYGKLDTDILGGGRSSNLCTPVSRRMFEKEIAKIHKKGLKFNYLINSICLDNQELSRSMQRQLRELLDWLEDSSVDSVTLTLPYLSGFMKRNYPNFKLVVSTMAQIDTIDKAKFWEEMGVDTITLYEVNVNRDLKLLESIRKAVKCRLQLIANNGCLHNCPFTIYHSLLSSHASQKSHISKGFILEFYRVMCSYMRLKDPVNFLRADWIRPEDLSIYEDLGIDFIKIVNRGISTDGLRLMVKAYTEREYDGNLLDLLPKSSRNINFKKTGLRYLFRFFFHPRLVNIFKLPRIRESFSAIEDCVYIDNKKLDGFLFSLQDKNCSLRLCSDCYWCKGIADKVVRIDEKKISKAIPKMEELLEEFISGKLFQYPLDL